MNVNEPPFKVGDICVSTGTGWAFVPLKVEYELVKKNGRWLYGYTDVIDQRWRLATKEDIVEMIARETRDISRISQTLKKYCEILQAMKESPAPPLSEGA